MKNNLLVNCFLITVVCSSFSTALNVTRCHEDEKGLDEIDQKVTIGRCSKPPCRLKKGTVVPIEIEFTPSIDTPILFNRVAAKIVGIPFPFIGVDGTDACKNVYSADGKKLVGCPLKKGEKYVFKNQFDILDIYPKIKLTVHWGLEGASAINVVCFEVGARITN